LADADPTGLDTAAATSLGPLDTDAAVDTDAVPTASTVGLFLSVGSEAFPRILSGM
jgi:hypothetical protein